MSGKWAPDPELAGVQAGPQQDGRRLASEEEVGSPTLLCLQEPRLTIYILSEVTLIK